MVSCLVMFLNMLGLTLYANRKCAYLTAEDESDKLLLAAKKTRRATSTEFLISLVADDFSRASSTYVGKLRQVLATKNSIYIYLVFPLP